MKHHHLTPNHIGTACLLLGILTAAAPLIYPYVCVCTRVQRQQLKQQQFPIKLNVTINTKDDPTILAVIGK